MKRSEKKSYVSINPYNLESFIYQNDLLKRFTPRFNPNNYYISYINNRDIIVTQIDISKNIPPDDLRDVIELKAYEELDLDQTIEYKIEFYETPSFPSDKERHFHVFVTEPKIIEDIFKNIIKKIPYIDQIVPTPYLFKTLYTNEILESNYVDLFIYMQKEDTLLAIYQQGSLLYSKSLKYSFNDLAERFSELSGEDTSAEDIMQDLSKEGLKITDLDKAQHYMQLFSELFMHINDVLIYAKRANNLDIIDNIYFGSSIGFIAGIDEYSQTYLSQEAYDFSFDYGIKTNEKYVEDIHYLLILTAKDIIEKNIEYPNFSIFPRPAPLFKRPSGELLMVTAASLLLGLAYPAYNYFQGYKYKYEASLLKEQYPTIHAQRVSLENRINQLKKELKEIQKKVAIKQKALQESQRILNAIYDKKVNYVMKGVTLADLTQDLVKYNILVTNIENNNTEFDFNVTATDDKAITKFIKYIADTKGRYDITTQEINKTDPNSSVYNSYIKVRVQ